MILVDCVIGAPSFIQINLSGGDPDEVQFNVKGEPMITNTDDISFVITGAAV